MDNELDSRTIPHITRSRQHARQLPPPLPKYPPVDDIDSLPLVGSRAWFAERCEVPRWATILLMIAVVWLVISVGGWLYEEVMLNPVTVYCQPVK